jgi:hypothetical protein
VSHAVEILGRSQPAAHEALILGVVAPAAGERRVELVLAGGERAHAALDAFALEWLGVRPGDIVWVRRLSAGPTTPVRA